MFERVQCKAELRCTTGQWHAAGWRPAAGRRCTTRILGTMALQRTTNVISWRYTMTATAACRPHIPFSAR